MHSSCYDKNQYIFLALVVLKQVEQLAYQATRSDTGVG